MELLFEGHKYEWTTDYVLNRLAKDAEAYGAHDDLDAALAFKIWSERHGKLKEHDINGAVQFESTGYAASQLEIWTFPRIKACLVNIF
jgi:hypothetical protein